MRHQQSEHQYIFVLILHIHRAPNFSGKAVAAFHCDPPEGLEREGWSSLNFVDSECETVSRILSKRCYCSCQKMIVPAQRMTGQFKRVVFRDRMVAGVAMGCDEFVFQPVHFRDTNYCAYYHQSADSITVWCSMQGLRDDTLVDCGAVAKAPDTCCINKERVSGWVWVWI